MSQLLGKLIGAQTCCLLLELKIGQLVTKRLLAAFMAQAQFVLFAHGRGQRIEPCSHFGKRRLAANTVIKRLLQSGARRFGRQRIESGLQTRGLLVRLDDDLCRLLGLLTQGLAARLDRAGGKRRLTLVSLDVTQGLTGRRQFGFGIFMG